MKGVISFLLVVVGLIVMASYGREEVTARYQAEEAQAQALQAQARANQAQAEAMTAQAQAQIQASKAQAEAGQRQDSFMFLVLMGMIVWSAALIFGSLIIFLTVARRVIWQEPRVVYLPAREWSPPFPANSPRRALPGGQPTSVIIWPDQVNHYAPRE